MTTRRKGIIIMILSAVAVLLCAVLFCVSFAKWESGDASPVEVNGSVGQFYVEYPQYVTKGDSSIAIPTLDENTYYLQVQKGGASTVSEYYAMKTNSDNSAEKMLTGVYLEADSILDVYKGSKQNQIKNVEDGSTSNFVHPSGGVASTATVIASGYYDFYYRFDEHSVMFVGFTPAPTSGNDGETGGNTGNEDNDDDDKNASLIYESVGETGDIGWLVGNFAARSMADFDFDNGYRMNKESFTSDNNTFRWYIEDVYLEANDEVKVRAGNRGYYDNGQLTANTFSRGCSYVVDGTGKEKVSWTASGWDSAGNGNIVINETGYYSFYFLEYNANNVGPGITVNFTEDSSGSSGSGSPTPSVPIKPASPTTTGATDPNAEKELNPDKTVRQAAMRGTDNHDGTFTYKNYVCVSRKNSDSSVNDNSICYVVFEIVDANGNRIEDNTTKIDSIVIERAQTQDGGNPSGSSVDVSPRLYGYENISTLSQINFVNKQLTDDEKKYPEIMVDSYYEDGMYCILYFGDNEQQYFAMEILITTVGDAGDFYIRATASNENHWQRFKTSYGEPYTFYLGGLINDVWSWDPSRTTQFGGTELDRETDLSEPISYTDGVGATADTYVSRYPIIPIDISLTVNLTKGSEVKAYMLGIDGFRYDSERDAGKTPQERVSYMLPRELVMPADLKAEFINNGKVFTEDGNLNLIIPVTGEYTFRFVGAVNTRDGIQLDANGGIAEIASSLYYPGNSNYVVDKLFISTTATATESTVTFNSNGGSAVAEQKVLFGGKVIEPEAPTKPDSTFVGWYTDNNTFNNAWNFDDVVSGDMTLHAKWSGAEYEVTFDANGGVFDGDASKETEKITTVNQSIANIPMPTREGFDFVGWATTESGEVIDMNTHAYSNETLYAQWTPQTFKVTFNLCGLPKAETPETITDIAYNGKISEPTVVGILAHYAIDGWYTTENYDGDAFDFDTEIAKNYDLYAKWHADDGLYANDEFVKEWIDNGSTATGQIQTRLRVEHVILQAGATLTLRYNNSILTSHVAIRSGSPAASYFDGPTINNSNDVITNGTAPLKVGATGGWFSLYYDTSNKSISDDNEKGIWAIFESSYADLTLNENDGVYDGTTKLGGFTQDANEPYLLVTQEITLSATTTVTVKYNNDNVILVGLSEGSLGTLSDGNVVLEAGKWTFKYNYADKKIKVEGQAAVDPNAGLTYKALVGSFNSTTGEGGYVTGQFAAKGLTYFDSNNGYKMTFDAGDDYSFKIKLYLNAGDVFKVVCNNSWKGYDDIKDTKPSQLKKAPTDNNIEVVTSGYFSIKIWWADNPTGGFTISYSEA